MWILDEDGRDVLIEEGPHLIKVHLGRGGYTLEIDGTLVDQGGRWFSLPIIGSVRLYGRAGTTHVVARIRNMGVHFRLEVEIGGRLVSTDTFR